MDKRTFSNWDTGKIKSSFEPNFYSLHVVQMSCLSADFNGSQFYVPCDFDVADDVNAFTVGELDLVSIGKFHLKHVSNQFHLNLRQKRHFL